MKFPSILLSCLLATALSALATGVEYPLGGNFENEEGTIEMWVTPTAKELYPADDGQYHQVLSFFSIEIPGEWSMTVSWYRHGEQIGIKSSMGSQRVPSGILAILPEKELPDWKTGRRQRFAFVWKGLDMKIYADGKMVGQREQVISFSGDLAGRKIVFGNKANMHDDLILHAVRISSIARTPEELASAEPVEDKYTLLLDRFDDASVAQTLKTTPLVVHDAKEGVGGSLNAPARFVTDPAPGLLFRP